MEILIADSRTISDIQKQFNTEFPFLKLEFFDAPHKANIALPKSKMYPHDRRLSGCRKVHTEGTLKIKQNDRVIDLETNLWKNFGLSAQVFRKSGNVWIETSLTDSWTLEQQNREGSELSAPAKNRYRDAEENDPTDRDKWE